ncbi:hypothetical protein [Luteimonas sp. SDU82]|uniref:hypothetical protein n=1 Tax=Luteimonas sp. SDU82 TaxID=3422592 RepID=UPI003EC0F74A
MLGRILTLLLVLASMPATARTATAHIDRIDAAGVELRQVRVRLHWPADAAQGELRIEAARIDAPALGYRFADLRWQCPLLRPQAATWSCEGPIRERGGPPLQLAVDLSPATTDAVLSGADAVLALHRTAASPDATRLELTRVPLLWAQALLSQAWDDGRLAAGRMDGALVVHTPHARPLQVEGRLALAGAGLESGDGTIALGDLDADMRFDLRLPPSGGMLLSLDGDVARGEALFGNAYLALEGAPVAFGVDARLADGGWSVPRIDWHDPGALEARGDAELDAQGGLRRLAMEAHAPALGVLPGRYLSGWLGLAGLSGLALDGSAVARLQVAGGGLQAMDLRLDAVDIADPRGRFRIDGLAGELRHTNGATVDSALRWRGGALYELDFGPVQLPLRSEAGTLRLRDAAALDMLGGRVRLDSFSLTPPGGDAGLRLGFGLALDALDVGRLAAALDWPAFNGTLSGRIPSARYADERLDFDGGLSVHVFDGRIDVGALSMERPFGVAPTLSADVSLHDLDLMGITGAFDFGSISGRLHGRIDGLRLVDWTATAFDAEFHTEPRRGVPQRISQRAVQDISSVGDASFVGSLQGRLIGLFDDFGYRRIGIGCRLVNEVCAMSGLDSAGAGFTIVEGAGVPRLQVVGFNRNVDWPTLLERLAAVAAGDVAPVVD